MKKLLIAAGMTAAVTIPTMGSVSAEAPSCNWGQLTAGAIADGFPQGPHSSDPSGDGHGPGTNDEPRAGLANVVNDGDLEATCELIDGLLNP